jgi:DNA-binding MarR family transcriptional regulator
MSDDVEVKNVLRPKVRLKRSYNSLFAIVYDWMKLLGLSQPALLTYAWLWALMAARMRVTAPQLARHRGLTLRSVRRHIKEIKHAGLWVCS